eukprot:5057295-Pleurochrysis_carterae.AAC.1
MDSPKLVGPHALSNFDLSDVTMNASQEKGGSFWASGAGKNRIGESGIERVILGNPLGKSRFKKPRVRRRIREPNSISSASVRQRGFAQRQGAPQ